jgi:hypothetical protein
MRPPKGWGWLSPLGLAGGALSTVGRQARAEAKGPVSHMYSWGLASKALFWSTSEPHLRDRLQ